MPLTRQQKKNLNITDLEVYTMATEEAIDAKFEAFETCMKEKLRTIFANLADMSPYEASVEPYLYRFDVTYGESFAKDVGKPQRREGGE
ncbi:hypothetical protein B296_00041554 [Ensete ventricosum]|uniref:Uncharacterized protein n=1 Tax=Ensete ventricosum TaxID=4639 RepID=A0A426XK95_ENSVE|nr:hypothetical protein B296_00041554 [Ensete ventricosum]